MRQRFVIIISLPFLVLWGAWAVTAFASETASLKKKIAVSKKRMTQVGHLEKKVLDELDETEFKLNQARLKVRAVKSALDALKVEIGRVNHQKAALENQIETNLTLASQRLAALYKLGWSGKLQLLAGADSVFDFITRKRALERILAQDERIWVRLRADKNELESIQLRSIHALAEKQELEKTLTEQVTRLGDEQKQRSRSLQQIRKEKALGLAALKAMQLAVRQLEAEMTVLKQTPPPLSGESRIETTSVTSRPERRTSTGKSFVTRKGLLNWPVKGKVVARFGPYRDKQYNVENFRTGINIQAQRGEPIRAVAGGHTIYSNWFKGFGNMLIIDHGDHYYTVYAHLEEMFKAKGDRVELDEVVATVGDSGSLEGPVLHFEVRHHGTPADPLVWMRKG